MPTVEEGKIIVERFLGSPFEAFTFVFHGGEPLLHFDQIREWILHVERTAEACHKRIHFRLQSNLTLLTEEQASFLSQHNTQVGTSLDGWDQVNSRTRHYPNGESSFSDTLKGLDILRKYQDKVGVICVVTRHNLDVLDRVMDFFQTLGFCSCTLSVFDPVGRGQENEEGLAIDEAELAEKLVEIYETMLKADRIWPVDPLVSLTRKMLSPSSHLHQCFPCGAGVTQVSIGLDGRLFPCDLFFPDREWDCGSVITHSLEEIMHDERMASVRRRSAVIGKCRECKWIPICGGGCAFSAARCGNIFEPGRNCQVLRRLLPRMEREISGNLFEVASKFDLSLT